MAEGEIKNCYTIIVNIRLNIQWNLSLDTKKGNLWWTRI